MSAGEGAAFSGRKRRGKSPKPRRIEDAAQIAIKNRLALYGIICHHSPNEGKRSVAEAMRLKRLGMISGWPDLDCLQEPRRIAYLETKTPIGRLSDAQKDCHAMLRQLGFFVAVVLDQDQAVVALREAGFRL